MVVRIQFEDVMKVQFHSSIVYLDMQNGVRFLQVKETGVFQNDRSWLISSGGECSKQDKSILSPEEQ